MEGSGDASYLSSFIDCDFVITNGYDVKKEDLDYLKEASKIVPIYIMSDPDEAGENIRKKIHEIVGGIDIVVDYSKCNKNGKHGVAECTKEEIISKLNSFFVKTKNNKKLISKNFFKLNNYDSDDIYLFTRKKFSLGCCNKKQMIKRLNTLKIKEQILKKEIEEYLRHGN